MLNVNVQYAPYNATGNGSTDDTAALTAARSAVNAAGGGTVYYPAGNYVTGPQTLYSNVHEVGDGPGITTLTLKAGSNADLFGAETSYINMSGASGTGNIGGVTNWSISNMTLDGNYLSQTAGPSYCLRAYGYAYRLEDVEICHGYYGGVQLDWNGGDLFGGPEVESYFSHLRVYDNGGQGFEIGGPHDSVMSGCLFMHSASNNIHIAQNATGLLCTNCHSWGAAWGVNAVEWLIEAVGVQCSNCVGEGSDCCNVVILAPNCIWDGAIYGAGTNTVVGLQLGQVAGGTPFLNSCYQSGGIATAQPATETTVRGRFTNNNNGSIKFANEAITLIEANIYQSSGAYTIGTPNSTSVLRCNIAQSRGHSASAATLSTGNTITTYGVNVARVTASANVTGIILGSGYLPGQDVAVMNESAYTITFATSGSHVADGAAAVIPAHHKMCFTWNTGTQCWYRG